MAYLEHHRHFAAIVKYLVFEFGQGEMDTSCGFSITVYSRFDGVDINPGEDVLLINRSEEASRQPFGLLLYNDTGMAATGYHYDPAFRQDRNTRRRQSSGGVEVYRGNTLTSRRTDHQKKSVAKASPKAKTAPKQRVPTYLCVESHFGNRCTASNCGGSCEQVDSMKNPPAGDGKLENEDESVHPDVPQEE